MFFFFFSFSFSDRLRTMVNVFGDCVGVGIVSRFSKKQLSTLQDSALPSQNGSHDLSDIDKPDDETKGKLSFGKSSTESSEL